LRDKLGQSFDQRLSIKRSHKMSTVENCHLLTKKGDLRGRKEGTD